MQLPALAVIGSSSADTDEERLQKTVAGFDADAGVAGRHLGGLYLAFDEPLAASIPLAYGVASFASLAVFARVRRYGLFPREPKLPPSLLLPFLLMLVLGGFVASSAVVLWSLTSPLGALVFAGRRTATGWFVAYLALIILGAVITPGLDNDLPDALVTTFFVLNLTVSGSSPSSCCTTSSASETWR